MEQKINIAEMLRDCSKGMELYSPIEDGVEPDSYWWNKAYGFDCRWAEL